MSSVKQGSEKITVEYDDRTVRQFLIASVVWGIVGMAAGVWAASQLAFHQMNFATAELTFGRMRPLHTNAAIFAFVGNMMFAGIYYSTQRLCKCRTASDLLSRIHFWGWQLIIVGAAITLPLGLTQSKEYAELIWPLDIAVAFIWVVFAVNFFWTLGKRNEPTLYVAIWFYIATIITVAMLYIVNNLQLPTALLHSYPVFGGMQDALVQWWYGHNAVAFFLTTPILGIMYYYLPKAAERPVYSYRLSVVHFWSLVFIYIWAGPHHLLNTALPGWLQALGMIFSLMLWAPSWGGMLNGLLTLRGAWDKLRTDPVIKFFAAGVTFYGMATFEGPLLSIKSVNELSHYSDWTIGHVHGGTLGWNGFMAAGMFYWLAPRLWGTNLFSKSLANWHFWVGMVGILFYVGSMWVSGITQGLMLGATSENGTLLEYAGTKGFLETVATITPMLHMRLLGGMLYLGGFFLLGYNLWKTARAGQPVNATAEVYAEKPAPGQRTSTVSAFINAPVLYTAGILGAASMLLFGTFGNDLVFLIGLFLTIVLTLLAITHFKATGSKWADWYEKLLAHSFGFTVLTFIAVALGGMIQIIPTVVANPILTAQHEGRIQNPRTPLQQEGFDIYVREGCYNCHSQMIRTLAPEVMRYGRAGRLDDYSHLGESVYDRPFQWGSKRTGPDLARVGSRYDAVWHYNHMLDPRSIEEASVMPAYPWLMEQTIDLDSLPRRMRTLAALGVPYDEAELTPEAIESSVTAEANEISEYLQSKGIYVEPDKEIIALIAYLLQLGDNYTERSALASESGGPDVATETP